MKKRILLFCSMILLVLQVGITQAGELQTVTLSVDGMTCSICPITVKKALQKVNGVEEVIAKYEGKGNGWAKIRFDPTKTDVEALTVATEQAGYPSTLKP